jgi:hypothetical protein
MAGVVACRVFFAVFIAGRKKDMAYINSSFLFSCCKHLCPDCITICYAPLLPLWASKLQTLSFAP